MRTLDQAASLRELFALSDQQIAYLEAMKRTGLYGATLDEVVVSLLLAGIRDAVDRDFIKLSTRNGK